MVVVNKEAVLAGQMLLTKNILRASKMMPHVQVCLAAAVNNRVIVVLSLPCWTCSVRLRD
jgi:hypothetical protein